MHVFNFYLALVILACKTGFSNAGGKTGGLVLKGFATGLALLLGSFFRPALPAGDQYFYAALAAGAVLLIYLGRLKTIDFNRPVRALVLFPYLACLVFAGMGMASMAGARGVPGPFKTTLLYILMVVAAGAGAKKFPGMVNIFNQALVGLGLTIISLLLLLPGAARALILQANPLAVEIEIHAAPLQFDAGVYALPFETVPPGMLAVLLAAISLLISFGYLVHRFPLSRRQAAAAKYTACCGAERPGER
ncbi:MAG: hypothetical protein K6T29_07775 [Peptococcaceae bacterium]|nr:hypothetical protein [Peptococcaceae bacterium]